ncbi:unnamed protein product [Discosporangium mesarthrocarpum]
MLPRVWQYVYLAFFVIHVIITGLVDLQALPFRDYYPQVLQDLVKFHVETNHDHLMSTPVPAWFEALVWMELVFQMPFFVLASVAFVKGWNWIRIPCIVYGSSAFTSMAPILGNTLASERLTDAQRYKLVGICESNDRFLALEIFVPCKSEKCRACTFLM